MSPPFSPSTANGLPSRQTLQQAAEWFVLLASGDASDEDRSRWHVWRMANPAHEQAWKKAEGSTARFADIPQGQASISLHALNCVPASKSRGRRKAVVQLAVLLVIGFVSWQSYKSSDWSADQITAVGEQRETALADGSRLLLDTDSAVDIDFSEQRRVVRLRRGQIMIATAPDPAPIHRPFTVETSDGRVLALGTQFTVQQEPESTRVTVLEARVALQGKHIAGDGPILIAGQTARFNRDGVIEQQSAPDTDAAWTKGMLIANDMRLADLTTQLARYRQEPLACDPAVAELRISGAFPLRDTDRVLAAVSNTLPIRLDRSTHFGGKTSLVIRSK